MLVRQSPPSLVAKTVSTMPSRMPSIPQEALLSAARNVIVEAASPFHTPVRSMV